MEHPVFDSRYNLLSVGCVECNGGRGTHLGGAWKNGDA